MLDYRLSMEEMITVLERAIDTFFRRHAGQGDNADTAREEAIAETLEFIRTRSESAIMTNFQHASGDTSGGEIYIVEFRQHIVSGLDQGNRFCYSSMIAHIASSREKAVDWCKAHTNIEEHDLNKPWDFAIRKRAVDGSLQGGGLLMIVDWDGEVMGWKV
ncbi:MAG: hypothetical protein GX422_03915 [Deltaproteobacteria bacterium]|nr:hypothetical protein [Deltaproteobacteria bacterium]